MLWFGSLQRMNYGDRVSLMTKVGIRVIRIIINFILPISTHVMAVQTAFYCTVLNMNIVHGICKYGNYIPYEILVQHG